MSALCVPHGARGIQTAKQSQVQQRIETRACLHCVSKSVQSIPRHHRLISVRRDSHKGPEAPSETTNRGDERDSALDEHPNEGREIEQREAYADKSETLGVSIALKMLRFYKTGISPLMPPSCRFQPTCSSYAVDAYTRYGVTKGTIMTAWRLFRCTPWGDRGYDPAVWPPKGLGFLKDL